GRLVRLYMDPDVVAAAGKTWTLVGVDGSRTPVASRRLNPEVRVLHYADPSTALIGKDGKPVPGSALPVLLNRRYMIQLLTASGRAKASAESWAYGPWNWGNILWQIPKGVLGTPLEIVTGRDPNQEGYLGRVEMRKIEGGDTEHHGFFRRALGTLDLLDLMPDRADWYFDPSQAPRQVQLDSELLPGQGLDQKDLRAGDKDVQLGREHYERDIQAQVEDLVNAKRLVLGRFEGSVLQTWVEDRRGRAGSFTTSRVDAQVGSDAVDQALNDPTIGSDDATLRPGSGPATLTGRPGHIEVDRVTRSVDVEPGAHDYGRVTAGLDGLPALVAARAKAVAGAAPGL
ncbi:MAG: hypothetical protein KGL53_13290, partial [Elusimicrobia bacterium]|nr:hypothetical protein [Elusimicrobiota bacterium]